MGHEYTGEWAAMILAAGTISYKCFSILYSTEEDKENMGSTHQDSSKLVSTVVMRPNNIVRVRRQSNEWTITRGSYKSWKRVIWKLRGQSNGESTSKFQKYRYFNSIRTLYLVKQKVFHDLYVCIADILQ